jgi:cell volume regulation protein A
MKLRRRFYISWVGLRGAVPIVFATYPLLAGIDKANMIFHIVFFISVTSILIQGTTLSIVAKWLKVSIPSEDKKVTPAERILEEHPKAEMREIGIEKGNHIVGKKIVDIEFPNTAIIAMIKRDNKYITPNGSTVIEPYDVLVVLSETKKGIKKVYKLLNINEFSAAYTN